MARRNFFPSTTPNMDHDHRPNDFNPDRRMIMIASPGTSMSDNPSFPFQPAGTPALSGFQSVSYPGPAIPARPTDYPSSSSGTSIPFYRPLLSGPFDSHPHFHPMSSSSSAPPAYPYPVPMEDGRLAAKHKTPVFNDSIGRFDHPHSWAGWSRHGAAGPVWYPSHPVHGPMGASPPAWFGPTYPGSALARHPRSLTISGGRAPRARLACDRFQPYTIHDSHRAAEIDRHRDLRLDVDSMSYEELLDLGERIGSVNTGLSEEAISKCIKRTAFSGPAQGLRVGRCVICLEQYETDDDVGTLHCGHDYHACCVTTWLRMKNACPICKAPAVDGQDPSVSPL